MIRFRLAQLVVWSSSVDQRTADRPAHRACYRLPSSADRVGDVHLAVLFGVSGIGMAMAVAILAQGWLKVGSRLAQPS